MNDHRLTGPLTRRDLLRRSGLAAAGLSGVSLLGACSGGGNEGRIQTSKITPFPDEPNARFDPKATFTWMYSVGNTSFDPDRINTNNSQMYLYPIYDSLVHMNEEARPTPMLARSWQLSEGGKALRMKLIEGWAFHDGQVFDANAVKANIERSKSLPGSFNAQRLESVTAVEVVDPSTVVLRTKDAAGPLIGILASAAGMMMSPAVFEDPSQDIRPTGGSGAFEMTKYVPGERVEYAAVDNYWDREAVNVGRTVFLVSGDDNARLNAVQTGAADATFLRPQMVKPARQAGLNVHGRPSLSSYNLNLNTSRSEFGDVRVRQALNHAIDRKAISTFMQGLLTPSVQLFPTFYWASNPDIGANYYEHSPEKAKQLLREAGVGKGFSFDMEVINLDTYKQIAQIMQQNFAAVGITMNVRPAEIERLSEDFSVKKNVDAIFFEQKAEADPSITTAQYYLKGGFNNPGGYTTKEITRLHNQAMQGATPEERSAAYARLFKTVVDEAYPNVTVGVLTTPFAANDTVNNLDVYTDASRQFRGVSIDPRAGK